MRVLDATLSLKQKLGWTWKRTPKLRKKSPRLTASIQTAEERILLSGVTAVSDALVINRSGTAAHIDVLKNDSGASSILNVSGAGHGTTAIEGTGGAAKISYTAAQGFSGSDSFSYTVIGSSGETSTATVSVTVLASANHADWNVDENYGSPTVTTFSGFDANGSGSYSTQLYGDYTLTDSGTAVRRYATDGVTETHSIAWTLSITSVSNSSGGWTVSEQYTASSVIIVSGTGVQTTNSGSETFSYSLVANEVSSSGAAGGYTISANVDQSIDFEYQDDGSAANTSSGGAAGINMTGRWGSESHIWFDMNRSVNSSGAQTSFVAEGGVSLKKYSVDVSYVQVVEGLGTVSGTVDLIAEVSTTYLLLGSSGTAWDSTSYSVTLNGLGSYSLDVGPNTVTGSVTDYINVETSTAHTIAIAKNDSGSAWVATGGSGTGSASTTVQRTLRAGGPFSFTEVQYNDSGDSSGSGADDGQPLSTTTFNLSGAVKHYAFASETTSANWQQQMGATGLFYTTGGSGSATASGNSELRLDGWGTFVTESPDITLTGTVSEYFIESKSDYEYQTQSKTVSGNWIYQGSGYDMASTTHRLSRTGSGDTQHDVQGGSISVHVQVQSRDESNVWGRTDAVLDAQEQWQVTGGHGAGSMTTFSQVDFYAGSGPFSTATGDGGESASGADSTAEGSIPTPVIAGMISLTGRDVTNGSATWDLDWSPNESEDNWTLSAGSGNSLASGFSEVNYSGSGSFASTVDDWTIGGDVAVSGRDRSDYRFDTNLSVANGEWRSSGTGSATNDFANTTAGSSWGSYNKTETVSEAVQDGALTTVTSTSAGFQQQIHSEDHIDSRIDFALNSAEQWQVTGSSLSGSGSGYSRSTTSGGFAYSTTSRSRFLRHSQSPRFTDSGSGGFVAHDNTDNNYSFSGAWDDGAEKWNLSHGSGHASASGDDSYWFAGSGTFNESSSDGSVSGFHSSSGSGGGSYQFDQVLALDSQEQWAVTSGHGNASSWSEASQRYTGGGNFNTTLDGGYLSGSISAWGNSSDSGYRWLNYQWDATADQWQETIGSGGAEFSSNDGTWYTGSGQVSMSGSDFALTLTINNAYGGTNTIAGGDLSESYNANSDEWQRTGGNMSVSVNSQDDFDSTLNGSFSYPGANPGDPKFSGTLSGTNHVGNTSQFTTNSIWSLADNDWNTSGAGQYDSTDDGQTVLHGSVAFSSPLPGGTLTGSATLHHVDDYENKVHLNYIYQDPSSGGGESNAWKLTSGSMETTSEQHETIDIDAGGGFVIQIAELDGQITGNVTVNGLTTNDNLIETNWDLNVATEQFVQTGGSILTTSDELLNVSMTGGGSFQYTSDDGQMWIGGTLGLSYTDLLTSNFATELEYSGGQWRRLSVGGSGRQQVWDSVDVSGQGGFTTTNTLGEITGSVHLSSHDGGYTDYSSYWGLAADGSIDSSGAGTGVRDSLTILQMDGSGGYSRTDALKASSVVDGEPSYESYTATIFGTQEMHVLSQQSSHESWIDRDPGGNAAWQRDLWNASFTDELQYSAGYSGGGSYARSDSNHDVSGTVWEDWSFEIDRSETYGQAQTGGGPWSFFGGGNTQLNNVSNYGYSGSGTYHDTIYFIGGESLMEYSDYDEGGSNLVSLIMGGEVHENGSTRTDYSANVQLQVDGVTGNRTFSGMGHGMTSSSSHYDHSASGIGGGNWSVGTRHNSALLLGSQTVSADAYTESTWDEAVFAPNGRLVTIGENVHVESSGQAKRDVAYSGTYTRTGLITGGSFYLEGTLKGEWHVSGSTSSSSDTGWVGHLLPPPDDAGTPSGNGSSAGSGSEEPPPVVVTNQYHHVDDHLSRSASGSESFKSTYGVYSRTAQGISVSGSVTDVGKTTFEETYDYDYNSSTGKKIVSHSERNMKEGDGYGWSYNGAGSGTTSHTDRWNVTYNITTIIGENGAGGYVNKFEHDLTMEWGANGALNNRDETLLTGGFYTVGHTYSFDRETTWSGGGSFPDASGGVTTVDRNGWEHLNQTESIYFSTDGDTTTTNRNGTESESSNHYAFASRSVSALDEGHSYDFISYELTGGNTVYYREEVVFDIWEAEDNLLSTSLTENGQTTDTYDTWGHCGWYYWGRKVKRTTTYGYGDESGGGEDDVDEEVWGTEEYGYDPSAADYAEFGEAGAYRDIADLPADWHSLETELAPYFFNGGWTNYFVNPLGIESSVVTNQDVIQQVVSHFSIDDRIDAVKANVVQRYAADLEAEKQQEEERQAGLGGPAAGSYESDLENVRGSDRHRLATQRFFSFADSWASMTPGYGIYHDGKQAMTGHNEITGEDLSTLDRVLAGVGTVISAIPGVGFADDGARAASRAGRIGGKLTDVGDSLSDARRLAKNGRTANRAADALHAAPKGGRDFLTINGIARPIPLHDTRTPWYKFVSPKYDTDIWVRTAGRSPWEIARTWSHELQHFSDFTNFPGVTHLAARARYFPGSGLARYLLEFRGYSAGGTLTSLRTPLQSFNARQLQWLGRDVLIFGVGGTGAVYRVYDWLTNE